MSTWTTGKRSKRSERQARFDRAWHAQSPRELAAQPNVDVDYDYERQANELFNGPDKAVMQSLRCTALLSGPLKTMTVFVTELAFSRRAQSPAVGKCQDMP